METATKPKRTKTVFGGREIAHVWAHAKAPHGRSSNVMFEGDTIYSYGRHFPMGRLLRKRGEIVAVLITTRGYSNTTAKHLSRVYQATSHLQRFRVDDIRESVKHPTRIREYRERIAALAVSVKKARTSKEWKLRELQALVTEANRYAAFFGLRSTFGTPDDLDIDAEIAKGRELTAAAERKREREYAEARKRAEARKAESEKQREQWLAGDAVPYPSGLDSWSSPVRLRVRGSRIESSKGVVFPISEAVAVLKLIRAFPDAVRAFDEVSVGGYAGLTIDGERKAATIGCHTVTYDEIERIAAELKL